MTQDSQLSTAIHGVVGEAIGVCVERPSNMFEGDPAEVVREQARFRVKRLKAGVLHPVISQHLLNQEQ